MSTGSPAVRWYKDDHQKWQRIEPGGPSRSRGRMITFTDLSTGRVIGIVDGRDSAAVQSWPKAQPRWWRHRVRVVATHPFASFRAAVRHGYPQQECPWTISTS